MTGTKPTGVGHGTTELGTPLARPAGFDVPMNFYRGCVSMPFLNRERRDPSRVLDGREYRLTTMRGRGKCPNLKRMVARIQAESGASAILSSFSVPSFFFRVDR